MYRIRDASGQFVARSRSKASAHRRTRSKRHVGSGVVNMAGGAFVRSKCPSCGQDVARIRMGEHQRSAACRMNVRSSRALQQLRDVGGYVSYTTDCTLVLFPISKRPQKLLACALDDLGHMTVVDQNGNVRQYLHGEWAYAGRTEHMMMRRI
jgi:hypothetical protein